MKRLLLGFFIMATWMVVSCGTTVTMEKGCFGFWNDNGPKRGTLEKNRRNKHPYRQCVDEIPPHKDLERRPYG